MTKRVYCRCNSGHYFIGEFCPFDGWSSPASRALVDACERLAETHQEVSLEALKKVGVSQDALKRMILITFGCDESTFDAVAAQELVVDGQAKSPRQLNRHFK